MYRVAFLLALATSSSANNNRIIGGNEVDIQDFNYQVSMRYMSLHLWGGALVKPSVVVTKASRLKIFDANLRALEVYAGTNRNKWDDGEIRKVVAMHLHPQYDERKFSFNVGVAILNQPYKLTERIGTIELAPVSVPMETGIYSVVTGWGEIGDETYPRHLRAVYLPKMDKSYCRKLYEGSFSVTDDMECWGNDFAGKKACNRDDGGPLAVRGKNEKLQLAGILSWHAWDCVTSKLPGIYVDMTNESINKFVTQF